LINSHTIKIKEFEAIGPRYNKSSDELIIVFKGALLIETEGRNIVLYEKEECKIIEKQPYKLSGITDVELFVIYSGEIEDVVDSIEKEEERDTCPKQLSFSWPQ
jgi:hypothetical protein